MPQDKRDDPQHKRPKGTGLEIRHQRFGKLVVVSPDGRIDHSTSDEFRKSVEGLLESEGAQLQGIVFDLSSVEYVSSAGLRCFMLAARQSKTRGNSMVVAAMQPVVREIFEISRFTLIFETFASVRDAVARLAPAALAAFDSR
jgi:anti-sigma B factor antagonist